MHKNTVAEKGVRVALEEPERRLFYDKKDPLRAMVYRGRDDPTWRDTMENVVRNHYPEFIRGYDFDEEFLQFMSENALWRAEHPLVLTTPSTDPLLNPRTRVPV